MELRLITLSENTAGRVGLLGEWGLSILVEADNLKVMFDTGLSISAAHNATALGVDLAQVDKIVLSHGHRDHTGGLRDVLTSMRKEVQVIAHPEIWASKYSRTFSQREQYAGIPFAKEALESMGASFNLTREPVWISDSIVTSGEIPMVTAYEEIDPDLYVKEGGELHPDPLGDDQALIIKTELGLVVVLGCAHRGIINTLRYAQQLSGMELIHTVVGGTHLMRASEERLELTIADLREMGVQRLGVSHCTGLPAAARLSLEFGDSFFFCNAGTQVSLTASI